MYWRRISVQLVITKHRISCARYAMMPAVRAMALVHCSAILVPQTTVISRWATVDRAVPIIKIQWRIIVVCFTVLINAPVAAFSVVVVFDRAAVKAVIVAPIMRVENVFRIFCFWHITQSVEVLEPNVTKVESWLLAEWKVQLLYGHYVAKN